MRRLFSIRSRVTKDAFLGALLVLLTSGLSGCKQPPSPIDGYGKWRFGITTAKDGIACSKRDTYTFCSNNGPVVIAEQKTNINLYFDGVESTSPLSEIELAIPRCRPQSVARALLTKLGKPTETTKAKMRWLGSHSTILALVPAEDDECLVYFLRPTDKTRAAELWK